MQIEENFSLKPYNSFGIDVKARRFASFHSLQELQELLDREEEQRVPGTNGPIVLGGGSNILFTRDVDGLVLKNEIMGVGNLQENNDSILLRAGAGENWHQFVMYCVQNNWAGIENLSLIPGLVGATPMQNIGAYGVEIESVFEELEAFHIREKKLVKFKKKDCEFGYRESIFKKRYKGQFIILHVRYRLNKKPRFNTSYGAIEQELEQMGVKELSIKAISDAVIHIRSSKLPDPAVLGNAGSFFKNPEINEVYFERLKKDFPGIVGYPIENQKVKLAAGWLIEQCGWKGFRKGDAGCHSRQALVLVNYGRASGHDIFELSEMIQHSVKRRFGIDLEREVNVY